jgi:sirohydrochlorin ferrochelatase
VEGFTRCVERGATEITVVPLFLLAMGHIKRDIPHVLSDMQAKYPHIQVNVRDPFGVQGVILDAVAELIRVSSRTIAQEDSLLIVGVGSSDPVIHENFSDISRGLQLRLGVQHVSACYLAVAEPRFNEGLEEITALTSGKVIVVPYLLFNGQLTAVISGAVRKRQKQGQQILHTGPLSGHQVIEGIVVDRATQKGS